MQHNAHNADNFRWFLRPQNPEKTQNSDVWKLSHIKMIIVTTRTKIFENNSSRKNWQLFSFQTKKQLLNLHMSTKSYIKIHSVHKFDVTWNTLYVLYVYAVCCVCVLCAMRTVCVVCAVRALYVVCVVMWCMCCTCFRWGDLVENFKNEFFFCCL